MSTIQEIQTEIIEDFAMFDDWMQKYEYLIDLGKDLSPISHKHKIDENLIIGCQSRVWLHAECKDNKITYYADSDAIMTKGVVALLIRVLSNQNSHTRGRETNGATNWSVFLSGSPNANNTGAMQEYATPPVFSQVGGYNSATINLSLSSVPLGSHKGSP